MCQSEYHTSSPTIYAMTVDHVFQPNTYLKEIMNSLYLLLSCVAWYHQRDSVFIHLPIERFHHVMENYVGLHNSVILPCMTAILVYKWIGVCMGKSGTTQPVRSRLTYNMCRVVISNILVR